MNDKWYNNLFTTIKALLKSKENTLEYNVVKGNSEWNGYPSIDVVYYGKKYSIVLVEHTDNDNVIKLPTERKKFTEYLLLEQTQLQCVRERRMVR